MAIRQALKGDARDQVVGDGVWPKTGCRKKSREPNEGAILVLTRTRPIVISKVGSGL